MLAFVMASMLVAASDPPPAPVSSRKMQSSRICRELGSAASRSQAIIICRSRAQWQRSASCQGATTYCVPRKLGALSPGLPGRQTAFELNEDSRIICRKLKVTGSRLQFVSACLPKREWDRMHSNSREEVSELQDKYSKQPRNE